MRWRLGAERWYLTTWFGTPALLVRTGIEIGPPVLLSKIWIIRERALSLTEAKSLELCLGHSGYYVAVGQWWLLYYFYNKRTQKRGNFFKEEIERQQPITLFYDADISLVRVLDSSWLNWLGVTINSPCLPKGCSISGFSFALLGRLLPWKYKRCFILTTRIVSVSIKRHSPLPLLCSVSSEKTPHPLTWNTIFPCLRLNLYSCAPLFFAFSSNVLARAGNRTELGRSGQDRPSFPPVLPHKTSEGEVSDSHCNPMCTFSRVNRAPKQTPAQTKCGAGHVQWMMSFQSKHGIWVTRTNQVWLLHGVLAVYRSLQDGQQSLWEAFVMVVHTWLRPIRENWYYYSRLSWSYCIATVLKLLTRSAQCNQVFV